MTVRFFAIAAPDASIVYDPAGRITAEDAGDPSTDPTSPLVRAGAQFHNGVMSERSVEQQNQEVAA
ncbi:MAG: hypothetical protein ACRDZ7_14380 [Acidimicrobiia bacterium]